MFDKRKHERRELTQELSVFLSNSEKPLGQVLNITPAGMMVRTTLPVTAKEDYTLAVTLPKKWFRERHIELQAKTIWCRAEDIPPTTYHAGFQLLNLNEKDLDLIQNLLKRMA